jgi:hypothetical protein
MPMVSIDPALDRCRSRSIPTLLRARVGAGLEKERLRDAVRASLARLDPFAQLLHRQSVLCLFAGRSPQSKAQGINGRLIRHSSRERKMSSW